MVVCTANQISNDSWIFHQAASRSTNYLHRRVKVLHPTMNLEDWLMKIHCQVESLRFQRGVFGSVQTLNTQKSNNNTKQTNKTNRCSSFLVRLFSPDLRCPPRLWAHSTAFGRWSTLSAAGSGSMGPRCGSGDKGYAIRRQEGGWTF